MRFNIKFLKKNIDFIIIFLLILPLCLPLFHRGFFSFHDIQHLARLSELDYALKNGQFPVRWVQNLGFGYGYPLFVFYPPLIYYLSEFFHLLGFSLIVSFKITLFLGFLLSGFFMYLLVKELWGRKEALLASVLYLFLPYRAVTIYVRGAMAEFFSFVWLPAIFWGLIKFNQTGKRKYLLLASLFYSLLIITHSLIALPFCFFLFPFLAWTLLIKKFKNFKQILFFLVLSLGLSTFFWLPSLWEKKYTLVDKILTSELADYHLHFVYPEQLWNSLWGYGGSAPGKLDGLSFKIGKLHLLLALISFLTALGIFLKKRLKAGYFCLFFVFFLEAVFFTLKLSLPVWERFPPLWYLQFPWRFLVFVGFFVSLLGVYFLSFIKKPKMKWGLVILFSLIAVYFNLKLFQPQFYYPEKKDIDYVNQERIKWTVSRSSFEYLPKGVKLKKSEYGTSIPDLNKNETAQTIGEIIKGNGQFSVLKNIPQRKIVNINAQTDLTFRFNTFHFPGWQARLDGEKVIISDNNRLKLIEV